ncbi:SurA N-terminal domain-containing protein [Martelella sp. HB161492]|uniref:SurA N-terminal domain-containing protein n=1 Tax=Martelella sp. HB161492 TaxID=2720726 RepID=UPI0015906556|nr:SurA N-terminal domain-containing protein [Martelella sp. HB161492]
MLDVMRKGAQTWVAKLLLIVLVVSFGIWGVSSSLLSGSSDVVIKVGDQEVSTNEFRLAYQRQLNSLSQQYGRQLSSEQARMLGVDQQVYAQLIAGAALDQIASEMKLGLSEDRLAQIISEDKSFQGANGQFSRQQFTALLRNAGLSEDDYVAATSKIAVRSQIVDALADGFTPPKTLVDAIREFRTQSRVVDYLVLTNAFIDPIKSPGDDVLKPWFEERKPIYKAPEYRGISYVELKPADIADPAAISDADVKADYESRIANYTTPEKRTIEQLTFANQADAEAAAEALKDGSKTFDQLVKDQGATIDDVSLGTFAKGELPNAAVDEAAFSIQKSGGTSGVVQGAFGPVIVRVSNITPESVASFDSVKAQIRQDLAIQQASDDILNVENQYDDLRASGKTLAEAAEALNLKPKTIDNVDSKGLDQNGDQVPDVPLGTQLISAAFAAEQGTENLPLRLSDGGYVWYEVTDVTPSRDRTFDEVRSKVEADWAAAEQKKELEAKAKELQAEVEAGTSLQDIADDLAISVQESKPIRRNSQDPDLGPDAVAAAFSGQLSTVATAPRDNGDEQILLKVTAIVDAGDAIASNADEQSINQVATAAGDDILDEMVNKLRSEYGVKINQTLAQQITNM